MSTPFAFAVVVILVSVERVISLGLDAKGERLSPIWRILLGPSRTAAQPRDRSRRNNYSAYNTLCQVE